MPKQQIDNLPVRDATHCLKIFNLQLSTSCDNMVVMCLLALPDFFMSALQIVLARLKSSQFWARILGKTICLSYLENLVDAASNLFYCSHRLPVNIVIGISINKQTCQSCMCMDVQYHVWEQTFTFRFQILSMPIPNHNTKKYFE